MDYILKAESGHIHIEGGDANFSIGKVLENIQLSDRVSKLEKIKIKEWFNDNFDNLDTAIGDLENFVEKLTDGLNGIVPNEIIDFIVQIISSM